METTSMLQTKLKRETFHLKTKKTPNKCDVLRNLVSFVQFKKHENYPWRSVTFGKDAGINLQLY